MKQALAYEFKRILLPLCIFTAIAAVLFAAIALSTDFIDVYHEFADPSGTAIIETEHPGDTLLTLPTVLLCLLCTAVPAMQYAYRMKRRSVDLWYSLPVSRLGLMFVRTVGGFALVLVPYTVSYWLGFTVIACSENLFHLVWYVPFFFASIPVGLLLYGVNAFVFTRANTVGDGILFMLLWAFVFLAALAYPNAYLNNLPHEMTNATYYISYGPMGWLFSGFANAVRTGRVSIPDPAFLYTFWSILGAAAYFGLFFTAKRHPAENAGRISDSWFGYRVLIPAYLFCGASTLGNIFSLYTLPSLAMLLVAGLVAFIVYRRSFRLRSQDVLSLFIPVLAGCLLSLLTVLYFTGNL